jgi:oligopeptidase A
MTNHSLNFTNFDPSLFPKNLKSLLEYNQQTIQTLLQTPEPFTWDNLMHPLDNLDDTLSKLWGILVHLHAVMNSPELREAYQASLPMLSAYASSIHHNQTLYQAIQSIDTNTLDTTQRKIITDTLRDFKLAGVALPPEKQTRFEAMSARLAELSSQFENNILDTTNAYTYLITDKTRLKGLPEHTLLSAQARAKQDNQEGWILTLDMPCFLAVITYADDRALRKTLHEAFATRASDLGPHAGAFDNTTCLHEILALRHEEATLLDFKHYADLSLATKMAVSPSQIFDFIDTLLQHVRPQAIQEAEALTAYAKKHCNIATLEPWDVAYVSQKKKETRYAINDEAIRPYFPLPHVLQGMFKLARALYGIQFEDITASVDTWHPDVLCYAIHDETQQHRGTIYMDLFARPNKRGGAWMDNAQNRRKLDDGSIQPPIAFLTCNFAQSTLFDVPTLSHDEVITLFHECGHCLHHVLTQVDYVSASGINGVEWDAIELPSQFFENFCWEEESLKQLSAHVKTGEPLPDALFKALLASKNFQSGLFLMRQLELAWFDFLLHEGYPGDIPNKQPTWLQDVLTTVRETTQVLPSAPYNRLAQSFSHIFAGGYAAGYYSYLWAEMLSSDAFSRFEEEGLLNASTGRDFLHCILEVGSSREARASFEAFRGREATTDAFLKHHGITA